MAGGDRARFRFSGDRFDAAPAVIDLHGDYYWRHWHFGPHFAEKVRIELLAFLARFDPTHDLFLTAWDDDRLAGTITLDVTGGRTDGAHLRWFIVAEDCHGLGLGAALMDRALAHNTAIRGGGPIWLTTFAGLDSARALYEKAGFALVEERASDQWQGGVTEQLFVRGRKP